MKNYEKFIEIFGDTGEEVKASKEWLGKEYIGPVAMTERKKFLEWLEKQPFVRYEEYDSTGDAVYIYVGEPVQAIVFKCRVLETLIPPETYDVSDAEFNLTDPNEELGPYHINMRLKLVRKFPINAITMNKMREAGIKGNIQGPRRVTEELMELIRGYVIIPGRETRL